jgi:hypothetical protein
VCLLRGTDWVFMCFVWIWEQTAIISLYSINWLVFITETECGYCAARTGSLHIIRVNFFPLKGHHFCRYLAGNDNSNAALLNGLITKAAAAICCTISVCCRLSRNYFSTRCPLRWLGLFGEFERRTFVVRQEAGILKLRFTVRIVRPHQQCCERQGSDAVLGTRWTRYAMLTRCEILGRGQKSLRTCIIKCNL